MEGFLLYLYTMKLLSVIKNILEQSVVGAPNNGVTRAGIMTQDQASKLPFVTPFSKENLEKEINKQGIKYPDIVMAQAKIESGHFTSAIFKENNNLFGMKLPAQRKTTAIGKNRGHAKYETWQDSVKDYKIWQDTLGWSSLSKETYIQKLSDKYCMPPDCPKGYYSKIVKKTMASG
jgi:hypothetical protein